MDLEKVKEDLAKEFDKMEILQGKNDIISTEVEELQRALHSLDMNSKMTLTTKKKMKEKMNDQEQEISRLQKFCEQLEKAINDHEEKLTHFIELTTINSSIDCSEKVNEDDNESSRKQLERNIKLMSENILDREKDILLLKTELEKSEMLLKDLTASNVDLLERLDRSETRLKQIFQEKASVDSELIKSESEYATLQEQIHALSGEKNHLATQLKEREIQIFDLQKQLIETQEGNESSLKENEHLNLTISSMENTIQDLSLKCSSLEMNVDKLHAENLELRSSLEDKAKVESKQSIELDRDVIVKNEELVKLQNEVKKLQKLCRAKDAKLAKMNAGTGSSEESQLQNSKEQLESALREYQKENDTLQSEMQKLQMMYKGRDLKMKKLEEVISEQERRLSEYEAENIILKESVNELNEKVEDARCNETSTSFGQKDVEVGTLKEEIVTLKDLSFKQSSEISEQNENATESERVHFDLQLNLEKRGEEIQCLKSKIQSLEEDQKKLIAESQKLALVSKGKDAKVKKFEEIIKTKDQEIESLHAQLEDVSRLYEDVIHKEESSNLEIIKLQKLGKGKEAKAKRFEDVITMQEKLLAEKETDSVILQGKISEMEMKIKELETEEIYLRKEIKDNQDVVGDLKARCKEFEQREQKLMNICKRKKEKLRKEKLSKSELEVEQLTQELEKNQKDKDDIAFEVEKMKKIEKGKKSKLNKFQEVVEKQESILSEKETDLLMMKERMNDLSEKLEQKQEEIDLLRNDLDKAYHFEELCKQHELAVSELQQDLEEKKTDYWKSRCKKMEEENVDGVSAMAVVSDIIEQQESSQLFETERPIESHIDEEEGTKETDISALKTLLEEKQALFLSMQDNHQKELSALNAKLSKMKTLCKAKDAKISKLLSKEEESKIEEISNSNTRESTDDLSLNSSGIDSEWRERIMHSEVVMQLEREIEDLKDVIQSREEEIVDGRNFAVNQQEELQALREYVHRNETEIFELKERIYGWEDWYEKDFRNIEASVQTMEDAVAEKDNLIAMLNDEVESLKDASLHSNTELLKAEESDGQKTLQEITKLKKLCKGKEAKIKQLEQAKRDLEERIQKSEQESNSQIEWRQLVEDCQNENKKMHQHIETLNSEHLQRVNDFESVLSEETNQILALKQKCIDLESKCSRLDEAAELVGIELNMFKKEVFEVIKEEQEFMYHEALESANSPVAVLSMLRKEFLHLRQSFDENMAQLKEKDIFTASLKEINDTTMQKLVQLEETVQLLEESNKSSQRLIQEKDASIGNLNSKLITMQDDESVQQTITSLENQVARLKDNISRQGNEMQNVQMLYNSQGEELEETLKALDEARNVRSSKMEDQDLAITHLRKRLQEEEEKCKQFSISLEEIQQKEHGLQQSIQSLNEANQAWQYYYQEKENEIQSLNQRCSDLQAYCSQQDDKIAALEEKSNTILLEKNSSVDALSEANNSYMHQIQQKEQFIESIKRQQEEGFQRIQCLENEINQLNKQISEVDEEMLMNKNLKEELENKVTGLEKQVGEDKQEKDFLRKSLGEKDAALNDRDNQIKELRNNAVQSQDMLKQYESKLHERENILSKLEALQSKNENEILSLNETLRKVHQKLSGVENDFEKERHQLWAQLQERDQTILSLQNSIASTEKELEIMKKEPYQMTSIVEEPMVQRHEERLLGSAPDKEMVSRDDTDKTIRQLREEIEQISAAKRRFEDEAGQLKQELIQARNSHNDDSRQVQIVGSKLAETEECLDKFKAENSQLQMSVSELIEEVSLANTKITECEESIEHLNKVVQDMTIDKEHFKKTHKDEVERYRNDIQEFQQRINDLQQTEIELNAALEKSRSRVDDLERECLSINTTFEDFKLKAVEGDGHLSSQIKTLTNEINHQQQTFIHMKMKEREKYIEDIETEIENLRSQIKSDTEKMTETILRIETQKSEMQSEIVALEEEKTTFQQLLQEKSRELEMQISKSHQASEEKDDIIHSLKIRLEETVDKNEKDAELLEKSQRIEELTSQLTEKDRYLQEFEQRNGEFDNLLQSLQQEIRSKSELANTLQERLRTSEQEKGELEELNQSINKELSVLNEKIHTLSNSLAEKDETDSRISNAVREYYQSVTGYVCDLQSIEEHKGGKLMISNEPKVLIRRKFNSFNAVFGSSERIVNSKTSVEELTEQVSNVREENSNLLNEIQNLAAQLKASVEENDSLKESSHELTIEIKSHLQSIEDVKIKNDELENQLHELKSSQQDLFDRENLKESSLADMQIMIENLTKENQQIRSNINKIGALEWKVEEVESLEEELEEVRSQLDKAKSDLSTSANEKHNLQMELEKAQTIGDIPTPHASPRENIDSLKHELEEKSKKIKELEDQLDSFREEMNELSSEVDRLNGQLRETTLKASMCDSLQSELLALKKDYENLLSNKKSNNTDSEKIEEQLRLLHERLERSTSENRQLEEKLKFMKIKEDEVEDVLKENADLKSTIALLQEKENNTERRNGLDSSNRIQELEEELELIKEELNETMSENENLRSKTHVSDSKALLFDKLQIEYQALYKEVETLKGNKASEHSVRSDESMKMLQNQLEESRVENEKLKSKLSIMSVETEGRKENVLHVRSAPNDLEQELNDKEEQISSMMEELNELTTENDMLKGELATSKVQSHMFNEFKKEVESLNEQNHNLLTENSKMAKTIEELHQKMPQVVNNDDAFLKEEREHAAREKETLCRTYTATN
uniref:Centromere-associated protein E-like n=1 Tax=Crassostrea virginica TaxID=6565 RepID=A0A8B8AI95_CRAVI|nr:centromere-associated protein E-like [Crassostrea virginica]